MSLFSSPILFSIYTGLVILSISHKKEVPYYSLVAWVPGRPGD